MLVAGTKPGFKPAPSNKVDRPLRPTNVKGKGAMYYFNARKHRNWQGIGGQVNLVSPSCYRKTCQLRLYHDIVSKR